jgi:hypothetical protein
MSRVEDLHSKLASLTEPLDKAAVLAILESRIATGAEINEFGANRVHGAWDGWKNATICFMAMSHEKPEETFQLGMYLSLLPLGKDENDRVSRWMRTAGLTILGFDENSERLQEYLRFGEKGRELTQTLKKNIKRSIKKLKSPEQLNNSNGFTCVQSVYIGLGISGEILELARKRANDSDFIRVANILEGFEDCEYLVDRIKIA